MKGNNGSWEREESAAKCGSLSLLKASFLIPIKAPELLEEPRTCNMIYYIYGGVVGEDQLSHYSSLKIYTKYFFLNEMVSLILFKYLWQKNNMYFGSYSICLECCFSQWATKLHK